MLTFWKLDIPAKSATDLDSPRNAAMKATVVTENKNKMFLDTFLSVASFIELYNQKTFDYCLLHIFALLVLSKQWIGNRIKVYKDINRYIYLKPKYRTYVTI